MNLIASVDENFGIGVNGNLLISIPDDLKYFREKTLNKTVIMGRKTFESLPNKKPLEKRRNIVLSSSLDYDIDGIEVCNSIDKLFEKISNTKASDIFVIGGQTIFEQLIPYCNTAYITKISAKFVADKYMVNLDKDKSWCLIQQQQKRVYNGVSFAFLKYCRS